MNGRRSWMIAVMLLDFLFCLTAVLHAGQADEHFDMKVRNQFFAGFAGDRAALDSAMKTCEAVLAQNPKDAPAMVWHGTGLYYLSGRAFQSGDQQKGMNLYARGMKEMDDAVALEPNNLGVIIPRGAALLQSTLYMPDNPQTRALIQKGLSDYLKTLDLQKEYFDTLGEHPRGQLLFGIADGYRRLGNEEKAKEYFERISIGLKGSVYQERADIWLQTKTLTPDQARCVGCHVAK